MPLSPGQVLALISRLLSVGEEGDLEAELVFFWMLSCIRREHLEKSRFEGLSDSFLYAWCREGKVKQKGVRMAFWWAAPRPAVLGYRPFEFLKTLSERLECPPYLIPARSASRGLQVRKWQPRPMSHSMSVRILRQVMVRAGLTQAEADQLSFNSCRRWLPTAAQVLGYSRSDVQALGGWTEGIPAGAAGEPALSPMPMGAHYCDQKALASAQRKAAVFSSFLDMIAQCPGVMDLLMGAPWDPDMLQVSWEDLAAIRATHPTHPTSQPSPPAHQPSSSSGQASVVLVKLDKKGKVKKGEGFA